MAAPRRRAAIANGAAVVLLALALTGCERLGELAPFTTVTNPADSGAGSVTVAKGDSAYLISRRYNVPLRDLIEINGLKPPYTLEVGQRLTLPTSRQYIVQKGDSLYTVSRMFNVDSSELSQLNNLAPPYKLTVGQPLRLPGARAGEGGGAMAQGGAGEPAAIAAAPLPPVSPRAGKGGIAAAELPPPSGAPAAAVAPSAAAPSSDSGGGEENHTYQPGQEPKSLRAPGAKPAVSVPLAAPSVIPSEAPPASKPQPTPPAKPAEVAAAPAAAPAAPPAPPAAAEEEPPARAGSRFLWPVKGKVISGYGPKPDGMHNDGLNIAANKGAPVIAADNGIVAYSGNELRGFGNLLLVKHADGWITAYAHLDTMSVERGAKVKRGQVIGTVGQTGAVTSPQLHFELRRGSQAIDPRGHLQGGKVSALPLGPAVDVAALPGRY
ncbi:murein DD-endopeptidase MepM/ murein hydrolase activator NlpD [Azospirillum fermentarium]|uniref:LysM peptidoglycan-binding domain-containing M23 family metallopeptidase n=1 Tax=Azospirillum fermentarium TaxID=1233114 RepID=UPI0022276F7D|nr:LysM peptidoglycan-binding domain-containing M23 family metallopeptidase [Azospirillum fermentarium]MCW2246688.1 murein DD-endopeptidase MepM/ murein hydrolase activator NlpD [Azospirillum fermentarium]